MKLYKILNITIATLGILMLNVTFSSTDSDSIIKLLNLSGLNNQIEQLPNMVSKGFIEGFSTEMSIKEDEKKALLDDINQAFNASIFQDQIVLEFKKAIDENELAQLFKWYESDLGEMITKAEIQASTDEAYNEIMKNAISLMKNTKRLDAAKRIEKLTDASGRMMRLQNKVGLSIYTGSITSIDPENSEKLLIEYKAESAEMEKMIQAGLQQLIYASFIYTYQDINDSDIAKYEQFLKTKAFQQFNNATINGIENSFELAIPVFTKKLAKTIQKIIDRAVSQNSENDT